MEGGGGGGDEGEENFEKRAGEGRGEREIEDKKRENGERKKK